MRFSDVAPEATERVLGVRDGQVTMRRLSEHAFWIDVAGYQTTVIAGRTSALVLDPLSGGRGVDVRDAVRGALSLPVSAIAYSHHHWDHIGDARTVSDHDDVAILATQPCSSRLDRTIPAVTRHLDDEGVFEFEGVAIEAHVLGGHSADLTWFRVVDEGVLHLVDVVHPGSAEFESFGLPVSFTDYASALDELLAARWTFLNAGHAALGHRADVQLAHDYVQDVRATTSSALAAAPIEQFFGESPDPYRALSARFTAVEDAAAADLTSRWSDLPGLDAVVRSHVHVAVFDAVWYAPFPK